MHTPDFKTQLAAFFQGNGRSDLIKQSLAVGAKARALAEQFNLSSEQAEQSGWLHAVGAVVPVSEAVAAAQAYGVDVLPEEESLPVLLTQKLSAALAQDLFGVTNPYVLSAIGCHLSLKMGTLPLDRAVFLAYHLTKATDSPASLLMPINEATGASYYLAAAQDALQRLNSLDAAVMYLCHYLWKQPESPLLMHPWFIDYCSLLEQT
jgi:HD superfamily phosphohydrolase YqeK